jgi:hypothetical protein
MFIIVKLKEVVYTTVDTFRSVSILHLTLQLQRFVIAIKSKGTREYRAVAMLLSYTAQKQQR